MSIPDEVMKLKDGKIIVDQLKSMVATQFVESVANEAGTYVVHNGQVYYLPDGHTANTTWANTTKEGPTNLGAQLSSVLSGLQGKPDIKESTKTGVDLDLSDPDGNVLARFANGHIKTELFDSEKLNPHIIEVAANGSIRSAVETAQEAGASADNPFVIQIAPGTYDILSEFTSEEISAEGFVGLTITDGITLEGMGILRDDVVLTAEMDTTTYDQTTRNHVSTLNIKGNSGLKNLTVKANNIRYAVHDDMSFSSTKPKIRRCEKCRFFATNTTSGGNGNISYGAGVDGRKVFLFNDCDFGDVVTIHTNTSGQSNLVIMENCRGFGFTATDYASSVENHYYLFNCVFNWIMEDKGSSWTAQHLFIHGNVKGAMVEGWDGMLFETGDTVQYLQYTALTAKKAVAMKNSGRYHLQLATGADDCIGIIYYYDSTNNIAYVQHEGWVCAELLGFVSPTIGYYLNVASDGTLSLDASDTSAIGKVICENTTGAHFIRLSI